MPQILHDREVRQPTKSEIGLAWARAKDIASNRISRTETRCTTSESPNIPESWAILARTEIRDFSAIFRELMMLMKENEFDEYGRLRPTNYAFNVAGNLLVNTVIACAIKKRIVPMGSVSTDSEGGVRVEWIRDGGSVHLVVPATSEQVAYIYAEAGDSYQTSDASPDVLASFLEKLS